MFSQVSGPSDRGSDAFPIAPPRRGEFGERVFDNLPYRTVDGWRALFVDVRVPDPQADGTPPPLVMWVHGGSWQHGSRRRRPVDLDRHWFIERMLLAGIAVAQIDYRLASEASFPGPAGDVRTALAYLHSHAADLGIDPERIAVWGESAGAHLALATGVSADRFVALGGEPEDPALPMPRPTAIVDWYGPTDLHALMQLMPVITEEDRQRALEWRELMDSYGWGLDAASPVRALDADCPPVCILHGSADRIVPAVQSADLAKRLAELDVAHEHHVLDGGHVFCDSDSIPTAIELSLDFLRRRFGMTAAAPEPLVDGAAAEGAPADGAAPAGVMTSGDEHPEPTDTAAQISRLRGEFAVEMARAWAPRTSAVIKHGLELLLPERTLPARLQEPVAVPVGREAALPLVVHLHSGGYVAGDLDTHDGAAARMAAALGAPVLQVGYRRAPEHPFPAAFEDAVAAVRRAWERRDTLWLREGRRIDRIVLYGESAGGSLALAVAREVAGEIPVAAVVAAYPVLQWRPERMGPYNAYLEPAGGTVAPEDPRLRDPRLSPAAAESLDWLPPTLLTVGARDEILDDVLALAYRARAAGRRLDLQVSPEVGHGYVPRAPLGAAEDAAARTVLRRMDELLWA